MDKNRFIKWVCHVQIVCKYEFYSQCHFINGHSLSNTPESQADVVLDNTVIENTWTHPGRIFFWD